MINWTQYDFCQPSFDMSLSDWRSTDCGSRESAQTLRFEGEQLAARRGVHVHHTFVHTWCVGVQWAYSPHLRQCYVQGRSFKHSQNSQKRHLLLLFVCYLLIVFTSGFQPRQERGLFSEKRRQRTARKAAQAQDDEHRRRDPMEFLLFLLLFFHFLLSVCDGIQRTEEANHDPEAKQAKMTRLNKAERKRDVLILVTCCPPVVSTPQQQQKQIKKHWCR